VPDLGWSQSKVSKTERGETLPSVADVELWARRTEADRAVLEELVELASGAGIRAIAWKRELAPGRRRKQDEIRRLEAQASVVRVFSADVVVGLAQTRPYAEAMFRLGRRIRQDEPVDEVVEARMARHSVLDDPDRRFEFLMTEAALRRRLVRPSDMREQVCHLIELSRRPNVELELITFDAVEEVHQYHGFSIIGDPVVDGEAVVLAETVTRALAIRDDEEIAQYVEHFTELRRGAVRGDGLRDFLAEVAEGLRG
jgi:uncharacterized protein DUF5753